MFTGIIEEVGRIKEIKKGSIYSSLVIEANKVLTGAKLGDSIATNGVCLTVTKLNTNSFQVDVMAETLRHSNLGNLKSGSSVNLERALSLETRLGGHIVSGHIDGVGKVTSLVEEGNATWVTVSAGEDILKYIVYKGSITIDGISLTVAYIDNKVFKVSIIPHTGKETTLLTKKPGDTVNLECDLIGKYVEKLLGLNSPGKTNKEHMPKESGINEDFLMKNGFL